MTDWRAPGPGSWTQDRAHSPGANTEMVGAIYPQSFERGFAESLARYGALLDKIAMRRVNGFAYHQPQPFDMPGPDGPPSAAHIKSEIARRADVAALALENRIWREDLELWQELKKASVARHRELFGVDLESLDTDGLAAHLRECAEHLSAMAYQHHRFNTPATLPVGLLMITIAPLVDLPPHALLGLLDGYSPASGLLDPDAAEALTALERDPDSSALLNSDGEAGDRLAALRARVPAVDEYVSFVGCRLVDGFDVLFPTLIERPKLMLDKLANALVRDREDPRERADAMAADLRARVPSGQRTLFDELLTEARVMYRLRDERGLYSDVPAIGLLRLAALEAGRRLEARGRVHAAEHTFDAETGELRGLLNGADEPSADELRRRSESRINGASGPRFLGGQPSGPPPMDDLPTSLVTVMSALGITTEGILGELPEPVGNDRVIGGITGNVGVYEGRARHIHSAEDLFSLEPGEVLVTRTTGEAFNGIIHLVGAVVTDHGSFASHAAIVAREVGFPAVVGTVDGSTRIPAGAMVRVDGNEGQVTVLS